jgi:hydroxypyruvate isomerase
MPRFAANITTMFGEWPFLERISVAASYGFRGVECQWPYEVDAGDVHDALIDADMPMVLINAPCGNLAAGEVGLASLSGREQEFRDTIEQATLYARQIHCPQIHVLAGIPAGSEDHVSCRELFINNVRWAADRFRAGGLRLMLEAINTVDRPGYHLKGTDDAVSALKAIDRPNVGLQFDVYHSFRIGENISQKMLENLNVISHMQISGFPGRHEPHDGEIPYGKVFAEIDALGYDGWVGCEYTPEATTVEGLGWAAEFGVGGNNG